MTRRRVIASNVIGPTNRVAACVITATTSWPRFCRPRATSTALYAPMPPVTPRATRAMTVGEFASWWIGDSSHHVTNSFSLRFVPLDHLHLFGDDFLLRDGGLLVFTDDDARRGSGEELPGARAGGDDEFEGVGKLGTVNHENVLTMVSDSICMRCSRARSATTIPRRRS